MHFESVDIIVIPYKLLTKTVGNGKSTGWHYYAFMAGIFAAATYVSQDARLRKEFYKSLSSQLRLFRGIGISEKQRELEKKVQVLSRDAESVEEEDRWDLKEEDVKQTLTEVLNEVYSKVNK